VALNSTEVIQVFIMGSYNRNYILCNLFGRERKPMGNGGKDESGYDRRLV